MRIRKVKEINLRRLKQLIKKNNDYGKVNLTLLTWWIEVLTARIKTL